MKEGSMPGCAKLIDSYQLSAISPDLKQEIEQLIKQKKMAYRYLCHWKSPRSIPIFNLVILAAIIKSRLLKKIALLSIDYC